MGRIRRMIMKLSGGPGKIKLLQQTGSISSQTFSEYWRAGDYETIYKESLQVQDAVNLTAELLVSAPLRLKWIGDSGGEEVEDNFFEALETIGGSDYLSFIARHMLVDGAFAAEIVVDENLLPTKLVKLFIEKLTLVPENHVLSRFVYKPEGQPIISYERGDVFYAPRVPFGKIWAGQSALSGLPDVLDELKDIKTNINNIATKMWKKSFVYTIDDSNMTEEESDEAFVKFLGMDSGTSIAVNHAVTVEEIRLSSDLKSLQDIRIDKKAEIAENFGLPRVLWSSGKSSDMGTLRPALELFYDVKVKPLQRVIAREITDRLLTPYLEREGLRGRIYFADTTLRSITEMSPAVCSLVQAGIITEDRALDLLGIDD